MVGSDGAPSPADIDAVVAFLPLLARTDDPRRDRMPWLGGDPVLARLQQALAQHGFVISFDWSAWKERAEQLRRDPAELERASLEEVRRLLSMHVRSDRFIAGNFAAAVASGEVAALLRRLQAIRGSR